MKSHENRQSGEALLYTDRQDEDSSHFLHLSNRSKNEENLCSLWILLRTLYKLLYFNKT